MREYDGTGTLQAFGLKWIAGTKAWYAKPDEAFWQLWRKNKERIKKQGFFVTRAKGKWLDMYGKGFVVFFKEPIDPVSIGRKRQTVKDWNIC